MIKKIVLFILCWPAFSLAQNVSIIPLPVNISVNPETFLIDANTALKFDKKNKDLKNAVELFASSIKSVSGFSLSTKSKGPTISFNLVKKDNLGNEGYELNVSPS